MGGRALTDHDTALAAEHFPPEDRFEAEAVLDPDSPALLATLDAFDPWFEQITVDFEPVPGRIGFLRQEVALDGSFTDIVLTAAAPARRPEIALRIRGVAGIAPAGVTVEGRRVVIGRPLDAA